MRNAALIVVLSFITALGFAQEETPDSLKTIKFEEVVVTGQFEPQSLSKSVYQVRTIGSEIIKARNATNVQNVLNTQLGIRFSNDPVLGTADISLMGMSGQNVKILLDGVPLLDRGATRESLNQIDVNTIEKIEIVEGPMSVIYGSDALAGVINIITKKASGAQNKLSISSRIVEETAGKEYDPFTKEGVHLENVNVLWKNGAWNSAAGVTRNNFGGWQGNAEGRAKQWLPKDQWLGNASLGYQKNNFNVWYRLNYLNEVITTPGAANPNTNVATDKEYTTNRYTHQAQAEWNVSDNWMITGTASYQDYTRKTLTTNINLTTGDRRLSLEQGAQDEARFNSIVFRGISLNKLSSKISLQSGVDININEGAGERIDRDRTIGDYALFTSSEFSIGRNLSVRPGLRFIYNTVYNAPPVIPSINTKYKLNEHMDVRASYAYGFRAPALRELYFNFFDASHSIRGNTDLKAEYSNSFTASLTNRTRVGGNVHLNSSIGLFYNSFKNLIAIGYDPADPTINTYVNISKNITTGGTFNNTIYWKGLTASLGFSYIGVYNTFYEDDESLPELMWTPEVNTNVSYTFNKIGATLSVFYKFTGDRSSYQVTTVNGESQITQGKIDHYQWADVTASKRINKYLEISGGVKNLLDVTSLQNTAVDTGAAHSTAGAVPMSYGRSYFLGLNFSWSK